MRNKAITGAALWAALTALGGIALAEPATVTVDQTLTAPSAPADGIILAPAPAVPNTSDAVTGALAGAAAATSQAAQTGAAPADGVLEYLPADIDVSIGSRDKTVDDAPDAPFIGIEIETMKKRMLDLEQRVEMLEQLAMQQQKIISVLKAGAEN